MEYSFFGIPPNLMHTKFSRYTVCCYPGCFCSIKFFEIDFPSKKKLCSFIYWSILNTVSVFCYSRSNIFLTILEAKFTILTQVLACQKLWFWENFKKVLKSVCRNVQRTKRYMYIICKNTCKIIIWYILVAVVRVTINRENFVVRIFS